MRHASGPVRIEVSQQDAALKVMRAFFRLGLENYRNKHKPGWASNGIPVPPSIIEHPELIETINLEAALGRFGWVPIFDDVSRRPDGAQMRGAIIALSHPYTHVPDDRILAALAPFVENGHIVFRWNDNDDGAGAIVWNFKDGLVFREDGNGSRCLLPLLAGNLAA